MDNKLLLVQGITLLYRESMISTKTENSSDLVRTVLEGVRLPELSLGISSDRENLQSLKATAMWMCGNPIETTYEKDELLQRLKLNCGYDTGLYEAIAQGIERDYDEPSLKRTCLGIKRFINDTFREQELLNKLSKGHNEFRFNRDKIKDVRSYVRDFIASLEPYMEEANRKEPGIVSSVDFSDDGDVERIFDQMQEANSSAGILKTGWNGLNDILQGGFRRGEEWVLPALPHNFKTGFSLTVFKQIAMYNAPVMTDPKKKPLLLRISFEDSLPSNMRFLYKNIMINETGIDPVIPKKDSKELSAMMAKKVRETMQATGYHVKMLRINPSEWTYKNLLNTVIDFEAQGYELHLCMVDYLPMMPTTGCEDGPAGHALRDLYRRVRNFFSAKNITLITPHQLSTDAKGLMRTGVMDFIKKLPGMGYFAGSKQIDQEVDGELYLNINKLNEEAYLELLRGKHRGVDELPEEDRYMALKFPEVGSIVDDIGKPNTHYRKIGGGVVGGGKEIPLWSFDEKAIRTARKALSPTSAIESTLDELEAAY